VKGIIFVRDGFFARSEINPYPICILIGGVFVKVDRHEEYHIISRGPPCDRDTGSQFLV
jgi:hypothetical protein